jgi:hypothetical protein
MMLSLIHAGNTELTPAPHISVPRGCPHGAVKKVPDVALLLACEQASEHARLFAEITERFSVSVTVLSDTTGGRWPS